MLLRHVLKLVFRTALLAVAVLFYFTDMDRINFLTIFRQGFGGTFLWVVWAALVIDMLLRIIPNRRIAIGARKHFSCSYKAAPSVGAGTIQEAPNPERLHKGALASAIAWFAVNSAILVALFFLGLLSPAAVVILMLALAVLDLVFILFYCPFRALFMRNKCCAVCRIYNWDYFMFCAPMILFPSFYSISLVLISLIVLLRWEIALRKNPHYFMSETNENLRCELCKDKVRLLKCRAQKDGSVVL
jgi:hypothetical protein